MIDLSLVIPSQNDYEELKIILDTINNFNTKPKKIIIIDSSDNNKILDYVNNFKIDNVELLCKKISKSYAGKSTNYSLKYINTKYTAFLDTKTVPDKSWILDYIEILNDKDYDVIFGSTYYKSKSFLQNCLKILGYGNKSHETVPGTILKTSIFKNFAQFAENIRAGYDIEWKNRIKKRFKYFKPLKGYISYNSFPKNISDLISKYVNYSYHTARADILNNVKSAYLSIFLIIIGLFIPIWNDIVWGFNNNIFYIPYITTTYLFLISLYLIITLVFSSFIPNFFKSNILFNTAFYLFLFLSIFSFYNLDSNLLRDVFNNFSNFETYYILIFLFLIYLFFRNIYRPLTNDVKINKILPFGFLKLIPVSLLIDIIKAPGYLLGSLILFIRILKFDNNFLLNIPTNNKKIIFFSKYGNKSASIRCRIEAYKEVLQSNGYLVENNILFDNKFFNNKILRNKIIYNYLFFTYARRLIFLILTPKPFLAIIHIELLPFFSIIGELILKIRGIDYVIDIDDAVYHRFENSKFSFLNFITLFKFKQIVKMSKCTLSGNHYHIDFFSDYNKYNFYFPTVIDTNKYNSLKSNRKYKNFTVVWIGTPSTSIYLKEIENELIILNNDYKIDFVFIGFGNFKLPKVKYKNVSWSEETEINEISKCHVGIMPLSQDKWVLGKCAYKILQYMACSIPVVATSIGVNKIIIKNNYNGLLVNNKSDWVNQILKLKNDRNLNNLISNQGYKTVKDKFNIENWKLKYLNTIDQILKKN